MLHGCGTGIIPLNVVTVFYRIVLCLVVLHPTMMDVHEIELLQSKIESASPEAGWTS